MLHLDPGTPALNFFPHAFILQYWRMEDFVHSQIVHFLLITYKALHFAYRRDKD